MNNENSIRIFIGSLTQLASAKLILLLIICLSNTSSFCQPVIDWDQRFGSSNFEESKHIVETPDGNYLIGGHTSSDPGDDVTDPKLGFSDYWIVKFDPTGNKIWDVKFGAEQQEIISGLTALSDGNFIIYGWSYSDDQFDKTDPSWGGYSWANDYWIVKFDEDGNKLWDKSYGGDNFDQLWDVEETSDGGLILGGMSSSSISGNKTTAQIGGWDMWVIKTDGSGNKQWDNTFGGLGSDMCFTVAQAADGGYYAGGLSASAASTTKPAPNLGSNDFYLVKMNASGTFVWDNTYGGSLDDQLRDLIIGNDGNLILGGWSASPSGPTKTSPNYGNQDQYLVKTTPAGVKIWETSLGGSGEDQGWIVKENLKNIIVITGGSDSPISGTKTTGNQGNKDYWISYVDQSGNILADQNFGGSSSDNTTGLYFTSDNGILIGGNSSSPADGDKTVDSYGFVDHWVLKLECDVNIPIVDNKVVCQGDDFNVDVTTTFACEYLWNDGNTNPVRTITPSSTGPYSVTVTDFNGCTDEISFAVLVSPNPTVNLGGDQSICQNDTLVLDAGNAGQNFSWSTSESTQTIEAFGNGNYSVTVTDGNNCSTVDDMTLSLIDPPTFDLGPNQTICPGTNITLDAGISGEDYLWSTAENTQTISVSQPGTYYLTVTNSSNCSSVDSIIIDFHNAPIINLGNDTTICEMSNLALDAGNPGNAFSWSTSESTQIISVSAPDTYMVTVTDANNCTAADTIFVDNYDLPIVDLGIDQSICLGDSLVLDAENSGATYAWSTSEGSQTITINSTDTYTVTVTDSNGCSENDAFDLTLINPPSFDLGSDQTICPGTNITLDAGISGEDYLWSTTENTQTISVNQAGTYYLSVTNSDNCFSIDSITIDLFTPTNVDLGNDTTICELSNLHWMQEILVTHSIGRREKALKLFLYPRRILTW